MHRDRKFDGIGILFHLFLFFLSLSTPRPIYIIINQPTNTSRLISHAWPGHAPSPSRSDKKNSNRECKFMRNKRASGMVCMSSVQSTKPHREFFLPSLSLSFWYLILSPPNKHEAKRRLSSIIARSHFGGIHRPAHENRRATF